ncbi:MAG: PPOX class F420-dependent oxidoreductase [Acidobacteriia bacterium]|nr:PPOX class F420-dependent oxidoreductase [Terriglobia bacterium]
MTTDNLFSAFAGKRYLNLETYRKDGRAVRTPVWFAAAEDAAQGAGPQKLYANTIAESGKAKRIRNNARVRIAPCDTRGGLLGEWVAARAEILTGEEAALGMRLLNRKYVPWKQLLDFLAMFRRRQRIVMAIRPG